MKNSSNKWIKIIRSIILDIIILILIVLVIGGISGFIQLKKQNKEYIDIFGYSLFKVDTGSMIPSLQIGDIIIVKLTNDVNIDDIVTFKKENEFITHRIIEINEDTIITKGDNNNTEDEPITKEKIVGKVSYIFNNINVWKKVFADKGVYIPIIITVILIFILSTYKEKIGEDNEE